jgi:hypothetical protein
MIDSMKLLKAIVRNPDWDLRTILAVEHDRKIFQQISTTIFNCRRVIVPVKKSENK